MSTLSKNIAAALTALALAITGAMLGCRTQHLGTDTGQAYDEAFTAQRASQPKDAPGLTADDAKHVMRVHRMGAKAAASNNASSGTTAAPTTSGGNISSGDLGTGGAWQGADGNISLEAK